MFCYHQPQGVIRMKINQIIKFSGRRGERFCRIVIEFLTFLCSRSRIPTPKPIVTAKPKRKATFQLGTVHWVCVSHFKQSESLAQQTPLTFPSTTKHGVIFSIFSRVKIVFRAMFFLVFGTFFMIFTILFLSPQKSSFYVQQNSESVRIHIVKSTRRKVKSVHVPFETMRQFNFSQCQIVWFYVLFAIQRSCEALDFWIQCGFYDLMLRKQFPEYLNLSRQLK